MKARWPPPRRPCPDRFWPYAMVNPLAEDAAVGHGHAGHLPVSGHARYSLARSARGTGCWSRRPPRTAARSSCTAGCSPWECARSWGCPRLSTCATPIRWTCTPSRCAIRGRRSSLPHFGAGYFREALMLADLCPNVYLDTSSSNSWMRYEGPRPEDRLPAGAGRWPGRTGCSSAPTRRSSRAAGTAPSSKIKSKY